MAITVKHSKVSTIPDDADTSLVRPSDWNADHTLVGTVPVANGGTGAATLTGYVIGNGTSAMTASTTIPSGDVSGLGTMATQNANAIAVTGGTINGATIGATTASTGAFTYLSTSGSTSTTPTLSFNGSNSPIASGATIPNSYLQFILQNKSGTAGASTNYVLSNDLGTDSTYYGEFGMNSSVYTSGTPADFFSLNNGIYFSGHDGDLSIGSGNGFKTYLAWGTTGDKAHVINASGAIGLNTNITGTTNFGTSGQVLTSAGSAATPTWSSALSGLTIDNSVIGATTPAAGTFTTITGQTEVLRGTGNNLLLQSQTFSNASWNKYGSSITANTVTAPDSTLTGSTLTGDGTSTSHRIDQATANSMVAGYPKTVSIYAQKGTNNFLQIYFNGDVAPFANFDLNAGTVGSVGTNQTATITNAGGGWYRCVCYTSSTTATNPGFCLIAATTDGRVPTNTLATTVYLWGAQGEIGSTANTYIPTTTTAVYGTPTLSFSGVAGLGLQSDGSLYVSPAGTGALQAQATTSSTVGGNARGANAVDWQTLRGVAGQVASGSYSAVGGGYGNTANAFATGVYAGYGNSSAGGYSFIGGGNANSINAGTISVYTAIVGGNSNTANGYYNFIGGGFTNSGTSISAVTTQSATMNATTAVTLSGSNASIKVGQYITGTSIASQTYVAAISGTSLTLSQAASGSSTSTLSFYTPHGVVVGGGNNQATGSYSFIGGGGDAGTAANRNVASGDWSAILGGRGGTTRGITGFQAFPACSIPIASGAGYSQAGLLILGKQTTDATATVITSDGLTASISNQVILPNNSAYYFKGEIVSGVTGGGDTKGWTIEGVIKRGAGVGTTTLVGSTVTSLYADVGAATWTIALAADTTNGGLKVTFTGQASTTIRTVAQIRTTEMTY